MNHKLYHLLMFFILVYGMTLPVFPDSLNFTSKHGSLSKKEEVMKKPGLGNPIVHEIVENVYAIVDLYMPVKGIGVNAGIIFTDSSIVFIDAGMSIASAEFIWRFASKKKKEFENVYLIITHGHTDHFFGMRIFKENEADIIGHHILEKELKDEKGQYFRFIMEKFEWDLQEAKKFLGDVEVSVPNKLIYKDTILKIDGEKVHILYTPGHYPDELSVYHPSSGTLFAGDTIYEGINPNTRFGRPEEWRTWISQLERLKELDVKTIVPGHGKLCTVAEIDRNIRFLKERIKASGYERSVEKPFSQKDHSEIKDK